MIYHVATVSEWEAYHGQDVYAPRTFEKEGFIHNCHLHQLEGVLHRYFQNRNDVMLLLIDEQKLVSPLKHEPGTNNELFPHIYGKINKSAIKEIVHGRENFSRWEETPLD